MSETSQTSEVDGAGGGIDELLMRQRLLVAIGPSGVGKTTVSAAIALHAAELGRKTLVLTIDPARRLANALGLTELEDRIRAVPTEELAKHGQNYGMWCAAWEDGMCTEPTPPNGSMVPNKDQGKHSCKGTMAKNCSTHWPSYDFSVDQSW